jgi:hypothetical protein
MRINGEEGNISYSVLCKCLLSKNVCILSDWGGGNNRPHYCNPSLRNAVLPKRRRLSYYPLRWTKDHCVHVSASSVVVTGLLQFKHVG